MKKATVKCFDRKTWSQGVVILFALVFMCNQLYKLEGDGSGDINFYAETIEHIVEAKEAEKPILVHCAAGTMRTGAAVAFYRLLVLEEDDNKRIL